VHRYACAISAENRTPATNEVEIPPKPLRKRARRRTPGPLKRLYRVLAGVESISHPELWEIGDRLTIGRHTYGRPLVRWYRKEGDTARVIIGQFVSIADDVICMVGGDRPLDRVSTFPFRIIFGLPGQHEDGYGASKGDIVIGNDVFIGRGVRIMAGVTVGDGAVLGAYSVVSKDVRPYAIVAGNPAREIRRRFTDEQVDALLRIRWWDWSDERILGSVPLLNDRPVEEFIELHDPESRPAGDRA
jgi:acetyltransferase-like isoleucine patch superfamily enzyme